MKVKGNKIRYEFKHNA